MNELKTFFRYLTPAAFFLGETIILITIFDPNLVMPIIKWIKESSNLNPAILGILLTAGIGYFFSVLHHTMYWNWPRYLLNRGINHRTWIENVHRAGLLEIKNIKDSSSIDTKNVSSKGAWRIFCAIFNDLSDQQKKEKSHQRIDTITDMHHGAGTTFIASLFAFGLSLFYYSYKCDMFDWFQSGLPMAFAIIIIIICYKNVETTTEHSHRLVEIMTSSFLEDAKKIVTSPKTVFVSDSDLTPQRNINFSKRLICCLWDIILGEQEISKEK